MFVEAAVVHRWQRPAGGQCGDTAKSVQRVRQWLASQEWCKGDVSGVNDGPNCLYVSLREGNIGDLKSFLTAFWCESQLWEEWSVARGARAQRPLGAAQEAWHFIGGQHRAVGGWPHLPELAASAMRLGQACLRLRGRSSRAHRGWIHSKHADNVIKSRSDLSDSARFSWLVRLAGRLYTAGSERC